MIERHYFKNRLVKSYDFTFGFCIPESTNTWEAVYDNDPPLEDNLIKEMVKYPYETCSDSFYFVGNELIMHNKAKYKYSENMEIPYTTTIVDNNEEDISSELSDITRSMANL